VSRHVPNRATRSRPLKQRQPRGLGKGRIPTETTRAPAENLTKQEPMSAVERAHAIVSLGRRLPLS
jgi:hypothetical protein